MLLTYRSDGGCRLWGCKLATYRSYGDCWTASGAVCWQPNRRWGWMLATYRSVGGCWTASGAVGWQPTGLIEVAEPPLGLYVDNLQVLWRLLNRLWGCMLATYRSYRGCWTASGAVCWQPTGLRGCWTASGAVCWQPTGLMEVAETAFGAVCWQPTSLMEVAEPLLGLYVGNLQVWWRLL